MNPQGNNYLSKNLKAERDRRPSGKRLGDRTLFSEMIDGKRYFSSIDAEIYFGDMFIDEVVQITWSVQQATMPIFGYNSYVFDDLAVGARQVSGSFTINFIKSGFLYEVLEKTTAVDRASLYTYSEESYKLGWENNFEKEHNASWNRSFNIRVGYGDYNRSGMNATMNVLYCVQITGCQQVITSRGEVIGETYTFIAKDVRCGNNTASANENHTDYDKENGMSNEDKDKSFTFAIERIEYEKIGTEWFFNMIYAFSNGKIEKISYRPKGPNRVALTSTYENINGTNAFKVKIPLHLEKKIGASITEQQNTGVEDKYLKLLTDIKVEFSRDGKHAGTVFKDNIATKIKI